MVLCVNPISIALSPIYLENVGSELYKLGEERGKGQESQPEHFMYKSWRIRESNKLNASGKGEAF